ncbi:MAG: hypothetical protein VW397_08295 [Candidatus Margulisiibacteriota bacterium]
MQSNVYEPLIGYEKLFEGTPNADTITLSAENDFIYASYGNDVYLDDGGYDLLSYEAFKKDRPYEEDQDGFRFVFGATEQNQLIIYERLYYNIADDGNRT